MDSSQNDSDGGGGRHGWSSTSSLDQQLGEGTHKSKIVHQTLGSPMGSLPMVYRCYPWIRSGYLGVVMSTPKGPPLPKGPQRLCRGSRRLTCHWVQGLSSRPQKRGITTFSTCMCYDRPTQKIRKAASEAARERFIRPEAPQQPGRKQPDNPNTTDPFRAQFEELKPLNTQSRAVVTVPGTSDLKDQGAHSNKCQDCGKCRCKECTRPRMLPSCWMCGRRCVCSMPNVVEYGTCVCCVKGLFYHCSSDDEDTCADKPFSCSQQHCFMRWTTVALLSVCFPCLLCYLPAKGCLAVCQSCYDRASRPGCRCKNPSRVHREESGKLT